MPRWSGADPCVVLARRWKRQRLQTDIYIYIQTIFCFSFPWKRVLNSTGWLTTIDHAIRHLSLCHLTHLLAALTAHMTRVFCFQEWMSQHQEIWFCVMQVLFCFAPKSALDDAWPPLHVLTKQDVQNITMTDRLMAGTTIEPASAENPSCWYAGLPKGAAKTPALHQISFDWRLLDTCNAESNRAQAEKKLRKHFWT